MVNVEKLNKDIDGFGKVVERINQLPNQFEKLDETSNAAQKLLEQSKGLQEEQKEIPNLLKKQLESTDGEIKKIKELVLEDGKTIQTLRNDLISQTQKIEESIKGNESLKIDVAQLKEELDATQSVINKMDKAIGLLKVACIGSVLGVIVCVILLIISMK